MSRYKYFRDSKYKATKHRFTSIAEVEALKPSSKCIQQSCSKAFKDGTLIYKNENFFYCCNSKTKSCCKDINTEMPKFELGIRNIQGKGKGLKALEFIPKDSLIHEYIGKVYTEAEVTDLKNTAYLFECTGEPKKQFYIDSSEYGNSTRFLNHSCLDYNVKSVEFSGSQPNPNFCRIFFVATKDIQPGEEITLCYFKSFDKRKYTFEFSCNCNNPKCKLN